MSGLLRTAQRAYDTVTLYKDLYRQRPRSEFDIPFISYVNFHKARGVLDCITGAEEIMGAVPALQRKSRHLPVTPLESEEEWNGRLNRLLAGLRHLGVLLDDTPLRFLLLADDATGPFACELSNGLGWVKHQASIAYLVSGQEPLEAMLEAFEPDVLLVVTPKLLPERLARCGGRVAIVTSVDSEWLGDRSCDRLLVCDELHVLGARRAGERDFHYDPADLLIEREPYSQQTAVTTLNFTCFALIRYALGHSLDLTGAEQSSDG